MGEVSYLARRDLSTTRCGKRDWQNSENHPGFLFKNKGVNNYEGPDVTQPSSLQGLQFLLLISEYCSFSSGGTIRQYYLL